MELVNKIDEKELYAARSLADAEGNNIIDTYAQKTEIPDVSNLATKDEISDMATESWVNNQDFAHTSEIPSIDGLMEESKLTIEDGKITEYDGTPFAGQGGGGGITASVNGTPVDSLEIITDNPGQEGAPSTNPLINGEELRIYYADYANSSDYAYHADYADNAGYASNADYASNSDEANHATNADNATYDSYGNFIVDTYATKEEIPSIDGLMEESKLTIEDGKITEYDGTPFAGGGSGGQSYTSPNETITVDNTNGTLEATKYAMAEVQGEEIEETMVGSYMPYSANVGTVSVIFVDNNNATITTPITYEFPATNWLFEPTDFAIKVGNTIIPMVNIKSDNPESVYSSINLKINDRMPYKDIYGLLYEGFSITLSGDNIGKSVEIEMALRDASSHTVVYDVTKKYNESSIEKIELQEKLEPMQLVAGPGVKINVDEENRQIKVSSDYNETVLWEGSTPATAGANLNVTLNLSESIKNFKYVVVFLSDTNYQWGLCTPVLLDTNSPAAKKIISEGSRTDAYIGYLIQCPTTTTLTYRCGFSFNFGDCFTGDYLSYGKPYKIVGIGRKAGV